MKGGFCMEQAKVQRAEALFSEGYNCAQAVIGAFCEDYGLSEEMALKMAASFGGGMGGMREVCGAVTGMFMVVGLMEGYADSSNSEEKKAHYQRVKDFAAEFKSRGYDSIICRELLELNRTVNTLEEQKEEEQQVKSKKKTCKDLVRNCAEILAQYETQK